MDDKNRKPLLSSLDTGFFTVPVTEALQKVRIIHIGYSTHISSDTMVEYTFPDSNEWKALVDASDNEKDYCVDYRTFKTVTARKARLTVLGAPNEIEPGITSFTVFGKCAH